MKRFVCLFLVCVMCVGLCACGSASAQPVQTAQPVPVGQAEYADQTAFLNDMAAGIRARLADDKDTDSMSPEEKSAHYEKLVGYELDNIEKYDTQVFADRKFDELAHFYIEACKMQLLGTRSYKNPDLYDALWGGGRTVRAGIIGELYTRYDLPLLASEAEHYISTSSTADKLDIWNNMFFNDDNMVTCDTVRIKNNSQPVLYNDNLIKVSVSSLKFDTNYRVNFLIENNDPANKVTCFLQNGYVDDFKISLYSPLAYTWIGAGKVGETYSYAHNTDFKDYNEEFQTLYADLIIVTTDGNSEQYIAKIPLEISRTAFN